jgi:hypothetical protein
MLEFASRLARQVDLVLLTPLFLIAAHHHIASHIIECDKLQAVKYYNLRRPLPVMHHRQS